MDMSWWDRFVVSMTIKDWSYMGMILVNMIALCFAVRSVRMQAKSVDVNNYFKFKEQFSSSWRKLRDEPDSNKKEFEIVEVLNLLEAASHLYNKRIIYGATRNMVRDYLCEVTRDIFKNKCTRDIFIKTHSGPDTYSQIRKFARSNKIKEVPDK